MLAEKKKGKICMMRNEIEMLKNMTGEQAVKYLQEEEVKYPMTEEEIIMETGSMGAMILEFVQEQYPDRYTTMMLAEKMLPFVAKRVEEAKDYIMEMEDSYLKKNPISDMGDTMAVIQWKNQARMVAMELAKEEVLYRELEM